MNVLWGFGIKTLREVLQAGDKIIHQPENHTLVVQSMDIDPDDTLWLAIRIDPRLSTSEFFEAFKICILANTQGRLTIVRFEENGPHTRTVVVRA